MALQVVCVWHLTSGVMAFVDGTTCCLRVAAFDLPGIRRPEVAFSEHPHGTCCSGALDGIPTLLLLLQ
nr:hypothetical protein CFP56_04058 [Quercus suber]